MAKKKSQTELLQEIVDLLIPVSNLARYDISKINAQIQAAQAAAKTTEGGEGSQS